MQVQDRNECNANVEGRVSDRHVTFEELLAPYTGRDFLDSHFGSTPLMLSRPEPFDVGLLSLEDVERLLFSVEAPEKRHWFILVKDGVSYPMAPPLVNARGDLRPAEVIRRYNDGFTVVLNQLHKRSSAVSELCHEIETLLDSTASVMVKGNVTANLYLTPGKATGFAPHYDNHEVIVLQLDGSKSWRVYRPKKALPIERLQKPYSPTDLGAPLQDAILRTGDLLYIPRGYPHATSTSDEYSMHLTIGIRTRTWAEVLWTEGLSHEGLRASVPFNADDVTEDISELRAGVLQVAEVLSEADLLNRTLARLRADRLSNSFPPPGDHLAQINWLDQVTPHTQLQKRHGKGCELLISDGHIWLHYPGGAEELPLYVREAVEFVLATERFAVAALPGLPSDSQRLIVARHLIGCGFVRAVWELL